MPIDVARARAETPGCREVVHLNNAGAALMPAPVVEAQIAHLRREARLGGYEAEAAAAGEVAETYAALARLLNCARDEIALVGNATLAWDLAFNAFDFGPGDRILTAEAEYASNYIQFLRTARRTGATVEPVPSDAAGALDPDALEAMVDERVKLIAVTHVPTNGGLVNPAAAIGRVARAHAIPFLLDACQSVGQLPIDVEHIGCDLLSASGRKYLRGPRGSGFLYVRRALLERLEPPFVDLHGATWTGRESYELRADARRFELWEQNVAAAIGLGVAVDYALSWGLEAAAARIGWLAETLRRRLARLPGVEVRDLGAERCGLVTFTVDGVAAAEAQRALAARGINVSVSSAASTLLDMERRALPELVRASVHYYNTEAELDRLAAAVAELRAGEAAQ